MCVVVDVESKNDDVIVPLQVVLWTGEWLWLLGKDSYGNGQNQKKMREFFKQYDAET